MSQTPSEIDFNKSGEISVIEMHLSEKLQKYINRIALTCMGPAYSTKYARELRRKALLKMKRKKDANDDEDA